MPWGTNWRALQSKWMDARRANAPHKPQAPKINAAGNVDQNLRTCWGFTNYKKSANSACRATDDFLFSRFEDSPFGEAKVMTEKGKTSMTSVATAINCLKFIGNASLDQNSSGTVWGDEHPSLQGYDDLDCLVPKLPPVSWSANDVTMSPSAASQKSREPSGASCPPVKPRVVWTTYLPTVMG